MSNAAATPPLAEALQDADWHEKDVISWEDDMPLIIPDACAFVSTIRELSVQDVDRVVSLPPFNMRTRLGVALAAHFRLPFELINLICSFCDASFAIRRIREGATLTSPTSFWEVKLTDPKWGIHLRERSGYQWRGGRRMDSVISPYRPISVSLSWAAMTRSSYFTSRYRSAVGPMGWGNDYPRYDPWEKVRLLRPLCLYSRSCSLLGASPGHLSKYRHVEDPDPLAGSVVLALPDLLCARIEDLGGSIRVGENIAGVDTDPVLAFTRCVRFDDNKKVGRLFAIRKTVMFEQANGSSSQSSMNIPFQFCPFDDDEEEGETQEQEGKGRGRETIESDTDDEFVSRYGQRVIPDDLQLLIPSHLLNPDRYLLIGSGPSAFVFAEKQLIEPDLKPDLTAFCLNDRNAGLPRTNFNVVAFVFADTTLEFDFLDFLQRISDDYRPMKDPFERFSELSDPIVREKMRQEEEEKQAQGQGQEVFGFWNFDMDQLMERKKGVWETYSESEKAQFSEARFWGGLGRQRMQAVWKGIEERSSKRRKLE